MGEDSLSRYAEIFPYVASPAAHHLFIETKQGNMVTVLSSSRLENSIPFIVKVNGPVEKFHDIFNQDLVFGAYTDRIDRTAVMFGKNGEIIIDDRLVAVASCDGRF